MAKKENQKLKLLYLAKIFNEKTDAEHQITMPEIINLLEEYGISAERKSLYDDIELLCDFGMDIEKSRQGRCTGYYLGEREFELPELKLLADAVQASKFITEKKSRALIKKLMGFASTHQARQFQRQIVVVGRAKAANENIYYTVDGIHMAILENKRIGFKYFEWTESKCKNYRHGGKKYDVSPWCLIWNDDNYYLVAYDTESSELRHYRVDKMEKLEILEMPRLGAEIFGDFDIANYSKTLFGMFGGDDEIVCLKVDSSLAGVIIDRFGSENTFFTGEDGSFRVNVHVALSPQFYAWVFSFGGKIKILSPEKATEGYADMLKKSGI